MKRVLKIVAVALVLLLAYPAWLAARIWHQSRRDEVHSADAIVVLGAAQYNGRPSPIFKARLDHVLYLYRERLSDRIIVTGGKRAGDRFTEAQAGRMYLKANDVPPATILEARGNTTLESMEAAADVARRHDVDSVLLVSDPLHSERIKQMATDMGFANYASWTSYQQLNRSFSRKFSELMHEVGSLAAYELLDR